MGDKIVGVLTKNESLKNEIGSYDGKWLEESKGKHLKQIDDEKRAKSICLECNNRWKKTLNKWHRYVIIDCGKMDLITSFLKEIKCKILTFIN